VLTQVNGSAEALFLDPIPPWMTEIPSAWAAGKAYGSQVEIYQDVSVASGGGGDVMKAVCDGDEPEGTLNLLFPGQTVGK